MTFFSRRREEDLIDEIDTHLALAEEEYRRRGMSAGDARAAAERAFGGVLKTRQLYRDQARGRWWSHFTQDIAFGVRLLSRDRSFALTAILVLGLGIGVNNMMFTLLYGSALRGLPIPSAGRVLYISTFDKRFPDRPLAYEQFDDLRSQARSFTGLAAFTSSALSIGDEERAPDRHDGAYTTAGTFEVIGIAPVLGRTFTIEDDRAGAAPVVLLSRRAWQSRYGGDPGLLGRSVFVDGIAATVIGIMPDRSGFPGTADIWLPLAQAPGLTSENRDSRTLRVFGRLRDGVTADDARFEVESIIAANAKQQSGTEGLAARVVPINRRFFGGLSHPAWLPFIIASILVVLVSCANAANLMIGRSVLRAREFAIRGSLGATRARLVCQLVVEAIVLAACGGALGWMISFAAARIFESGIPENTLPYWLHYGMDWRIFGALAGVALATVLLFGLVPAIQASRLDVNGTLRDGGRPGPARSGSGRLTAAFLVAEFALSVVLLAQVVVSFQLQGPVVDSDRIVNSTSLLSANITLPTGQYSTPDARMVFYDRLRERLASLPGVSAVTLASYLPFGGAREQRVEIDARTSADSEAPTVHTVAIAPEYFATLGVPMHQGREFTSQDGQLGAAHAIVNARFAQMFLAGGHAIGRLIRLSSSSAPTGDARWLSIVGVASDIRQRTLPATDPVVYVPLAATPLPVSSLIVRSSLEPAAVAQLVRNEAARIDPHLPLYRVMTMSQVIADAQWNGRASHRLILAITTVALILSLIGLYAVTAHAVTQRSQEIGIRVALGARPGQVRRLILSRAFTHVTLGAALGLMGAMAWDVAFASGRAGLLLVSPEVLGPVVLLLVVLTIAACLVPIRRAMHLNPVVTLRQD